jgi:hypothetical protein
LTNYNTFKSTTKNGSNFFYDHDKINGKKINGKGDFAIPPPHTAEV